MKKNNFPLMFSYFIWFLLLSLPLGAQGKVVIELSPSVGTEIDSVEKEKYHLFPDVDGFESAQIFQIAPNKYELYYTIIVAERREHKQIKLSSEQIELTRKHIAVIDQNLKQTATSDNNDNLKSLFLYQLALKYAAQMKYKMAANLLRDMEEEFPFYYDEYHASQLKKDALLLSESKNVLFKKGALYDHEGRTELLLFSGYYGLWLGVATPIALKADSPQAFALGLLLASPLSMAVTWKTTRTAEVSKGRAIMISLGGHLGTWQGIGWSTFSDPGEEKIIGVSELAGLGGIGGAILLTNKIRFSEGHAALTSSGLEWGAWFGLVLSVVADREGEDILRSMLIGSDVCILAGGLAGKNTTISRNRVRLITLGGVVGTGVGFGFDLMFEVDDGSTAMAIAGLGSVAGLIIGKQMTKDYDKGTQISYISSTTPEILSGNYANDKIELKPRFDIRIPNRLTEEKMPFAGLSLNF